MIRGTSGRGAPSGPARRAMTLIEVLVAVSVVALLGGIMMVGLRGVLDRRDAIVCLTHIRSMGSMVALYATDHRDYFPSWIEPGVDYAASPDRWPEFTRQSYYTMHRPQWLDYTGFQSTTEVMYCAANSQHPFWYERVAAPDYWLTTAAYMEPAHLDPALPTQAWMNRLGGRVQRIAMTRFPSSKAGMYEVFVWHGWRGVHEPGAEVGSLEYDESSMPGSVWFIDGHARQMYERDAVRSVRRHPVWPTGTFETTPWGMWGRDVE